MPDQTAFAEYNHNAELNRWPSRVDPALNFDSLLLREAFAAWRGAAGKRELPLRTDMTPRVMKRFLAHVAVLEIVREQSRARFRIRVTGTALERSFGGMTGTFLDESLPEPFRSRWHATLNVPLAAQCAARSIGRVEFRDQTYLKAETFYGPMGADMAAPDSMLVVVHTETTQAPTESFFRARQTAGVG